MTLKLSSRKNLTCLILHIFTGPQTAALSLEFCSLQVEKMFVHVWEGRVLLVTCAPRQVWETGGECLTSDNGGYFSVKTIWVLVVFLLLAWTLSSVEVRAIQNLWEVWALSSPFRSLTFTYMMNWPALGFRLNNDLGMVSGLIDKNENVGSMKLI